MKQIALTYIYIMLWMLWILIVCYGQKPKSGKTKNSQGACAKLEIPGSYLKNVQI